DRFLQSGSNYNWVADGGVTATTDGDILTLSGTTAGNGFHFAFPAAATGSTAKMVIRAKAGTIPIGSTIDYKITFTDTTTQTITITLGLNWAVTTTALTATKFLNVCKWQNQSATGTCLIDFAIMTTKSITITSEDEAIGPDTTGSTTAVNDATFKLRNDGGKYT